MPGKLVSVPELAHIFPELSNADSLVARPRRHYSIPSCDFDLPNALIPLKIKLEIDGKKIA